MAFRNDIMVSGAGSDNEMFLLINVEMFALDWWTVATIPHRRQRYSIFFLILFISFIILQLYDFLTKSHHIKVLFHSILHSVMFEITLATPLDTLHCRLCANSSLGSPISLLPLQCHSGNHLWSFNETSCQRC